MKTFTSDIEKEVYERLKTVEDDEDCLTFIMIDLCTEDRQKAMLEYLDKNQGNYDAFDVALEAVYIANRYPRDYYKIYRENLKTDVERRLYDKLTQISDREWWLSYIFNCLYTEDLVLELLGYLNEGHNDYENVWTYAAHMATNYLHRNCDWYDPNDTSEDYDDDDDDDEDYI